MRAPRGTALANKPWRLIEAASWSLWDFRQPSLAHTHWPRVHRNAASLPPPHGDRHRVQCTTKTRPPPPTRQRGARPLRGGVWRGRVRGQAPPAPSPQPTPALGTAFAYEEASIQHNAEKGLSVPTDYPSALQWWAGRAGRAAEGKACRLAPPHREPAECPGPDKDAASPAAISKSGPPSSASLRSAPFTYPGCADGLGGPKHPARLESRPPAPTGRITLSLRRHSSRGSAVARLAAAAPCSCRRQRQALLPLKVEKVKRLRGII